MQKLVVVHEGNQKDVLEKLSEKSHLGFDTETTGRAIYDKPFSLAISDEDISYYFNFYSGEDHLGGVAPVVLLPSVVSPLFSKPSITWYAHNAKFDLMMLQKVGLSTQFRFKCTQIRERLIFNTHFKYSLEATAKRYGLEKSKDVIEYIKKHKLYKKLYMGDREMEKVPQFHLVPFDIMCDYAGLDSWLALQIGLKQNEKFV